MVLKKRKEVESSEPEQPKKRARSEPSTPSPATQSSGSPSSSTQVLPFSPLSTALPAPPTPKSLPPLSAASSRLYNPLPETLRNPPSSIPPNFFGSSPERPPAKPRAAESNGANPHSSRDSGRKTLPEDIPMISFNMFGKYTPDDELRLRSVKVILRAKRLQQDGSLWLLCGPLSARVQEDSCCDVLWVDSSLALQKFTHLTLRFFSSFMTFQDNQVLREVADA